MKTLVITVYLGPLPALMPLWLRSAEANPAIDFLVITDQAAVPDGPANVRFQQSDLAALRASFARQLGFEPALDRPYKLCDFKPLFWMLAEDLGRYDYWGFCDLDLVFGDLGLILAGRLGHYDAIGSDGHFRLFRTNHFGRYCWQEVEQPFSWRAALSQPAIFGLDEHHGINRVLGNSGHSWFTDPGRVADIDPGFRQMRLLPGFRNYRHQAFYWENGKVRREAWHAGDRLVEEFAYIHLQKRRLAIDPAAVSAPAFNLDCDGIRPRRGASDAPDAVAARNPWQWPNLGEARIIARQWRRQLTGWDSPFAPVDRPDQGSQS
jgi:hypothetical protein